MYSIVHFTCTFVRPYIWVDFILRNAYVTSEMITWLICTVHFCNVTNFTNKIKRCPYRSFVRPHQTYLKSVHSGAKYFNFHIHQHHAYIEFYPFEGCMQPLKVGFTKKIRDMVVSVGRRLYEWKNHTNHEQEAFRVLGWILLWYGAGKQK